MDAAFSAIGAAAGKGSQATRKQLVDELFGQATAKEQAFLRRLLSGELHQGALEGVMAEAIARAAEVPSAQVRRALMLSGSMTTVAETALTQGREGLTEFGLQVGRPIGPMLASSAPTIERRPGQDHSGRGRVEAGRHPGPGPPAGRPGAGYSPGPWTKSPTGCPRSWPNWPSCPRRAAVLDGELIALQEDGRPYPFQVTASRTSRRTGEPAAGLSAFCSTSCTWTERT